MTHPSTKVAGMKRSAAEADGSGDDDNAVMNSPSGSAGKKKVAKATGATTKKRKTNGKTSEEGDASAGLASTVASKKTTKASKSTTKAKTDPKYDGEAKFVNAEGQESVDDDEIKEDAAETKEGDAVKVHDADA
jgi:hypothetical protein